MSDFVHSRLEECVDGNDEIEKCPECDEGFDTSRGVAMHYGYNHEGSIKYLFRCEECGRLKFGNGQKNTFCSKWCEIHSQVGTFKHFNEEYLREEIEEKGKTVTEVADELGVGMGNVSKWTLKYGIGDGFDCPSCDKSFSSKQGVSKHHKDKHGESIAGNYYTCENCGEENWTSRSKDDPKFPKYCDSDCFGESMESENNPNKSKERREKISKTMKKIHSEGLGDFGERDSEWMMENVISERDDSYLYENNNVMNDHLISEPIYIEETERMVRSSWEEEIDLALHESEFEYEYEPKRFDIGNRKYMPDFIIESDVVVEVKGYVSDASLEKAELFMDSYPEYTYFVVGSKIPCDEYVSWEDRDDFIERIKEILR